MRARRRITQNRIKNLRFFRALSYAGTKVLDSGQDTVTDKICRIIVGGDFRCHLPLKMSSMEFGRRAQQIGVSEAASGKTPIKTED